MKPVAIFALLTAWFAASTAPSTAAFRPMPTGNKLISTTRGRCASSGAYVL